LPACIIFGLTGISRAGVVVLNVQEGYFDRLVLTPVRRLSLLLGMMISDVVLVGALTLPVVHRIPVCHRPEDRQPGGCQHQLPAVLPVRRRVKRG
jgi:hypothetical protein